MIRILVADDHGVVRKGLTQIVADSPGMEVTGEAATGQEALELVRSKRFDVVILDISMPGRGGLDILRELKAENPGEGARVEHVSRRAIRDSEPSRRRVRVPHKGEPT